MAGSARPGPGRAEGHSARSRHPARPGLCAAGLSTPEPSMDHPSMLDTGVAEILLDRCPLRESSPFLPPVASDLLDRTLRHPHGDLPGRSDTGESIDVPEVRLARLSEFHPLCAVSGHIARPGRSASRCRGCATSGPC